MHVAPPVVTLASSAALLLLLLLLSGRADAERECTNPPRLDYTVKEVKEQCTQLEMVCLDQGMYIIHNESALENQFGNGLPKVKHEQVEFFRYVQKDPDRPVYGKGIDGPEYDIPVRHPTTEEYHKHKGKFSKCTVPIILYGPWLTNLGEYSCRSMVDMYVWSERNKNRAAGDPLPMTENLTIALSIELNLPLEPYHRLTLAPWSIYPATSLGSLSARHGDHHPSNHTWEGTHIRCFEKLHVCALNVIRFRGMYDAFQQTLTYYKNLGRVPDMAKAYKKEGKVMKVLFEHRTGISKTRQIINLIDIINFCNSNDWSDALNGSEYDAIECQVHAFGVHPYQDLGLMQEIHVFLTHHGSGEMNSLYMRENQTLVELRPDGFVNSWMANFWWPRIIYQNKFRIRALFVGFEEEGAWEPGAFEAAALKEREETNSTQGPYQNHESYSLEAFRCRDRHIRIKHSELEYILRRVLDPNTTDLELYKKSFRRNNISFVFANGTVGNFSVS